MRKSEGLRGVVRRALLVLLAILAPLGAPAAAQEGDPARVEEARELFRQGVEMTRQERWGEALDRFERSMALVERPSILFNIAVTLDHMGRGVEALEAIDRFLAISHPERDARQREEAYGLRERIMATLGTLTLWVDPPDAQVRVDGEARAGSGPRRELPLDPGEHGVIVRAEGHEPIELSVRVAAGEHVERQARLAILPARLRVATSVEDARIFLDGSRVGTGRALEEVEPGIYELRVEAPGYDLYVQDVEVEAGQIFDANVELIGPPRRRRILWSTLSIVAAAAAGVTIWAVVRDPGTEPIDTGNTGIVFTNDDPSP